MSFSELPVIDVGPLVGRSKEGKTEADAAVLAVSAKLHNACRDVGFFYITNHSIDLTLQDKLLKNARAFFQQPVEEKEKILMAHAGRAWRGYFRLAGELTSGRPDRKEGIYFGKEQPSDHPEVLKRTPMHGANQWPAGEGMENFSAVTTAYIDAVAALGQDIMRGVALGLGLEEEYFHARFTDDPTVLFRMFNYPEHTWEDSHDEWGVREHTDMGFLTLLKQDDCGGLQVRNKAGVWIEAPPIPNTFVVNIGDMLEVWTHGLYQATLHRVKNAASRDRLSFPLFFDPNWYCTLEQIDKDTLEGASTSVPSEATRARRWDGLDLSQFSGGVTYGEFVWPKISSVFPDLANSPAH